MPPSTFIDASAPRETMTERTERRPLPPGPWSSEPDRLEWRHAGLPCLANRNDGGAWCGYVAVPPGHPLHGVGYDDEPIWGLDLPSHGGLTYANACAGDICHVPKPGEPDDVWWFGFDCAHGGDLRPALYAIIKDEPSYQTLASLHRGDVYRDLPYVQGVVNELAEALAALSTAA